MLGPDRGQGVGGAERQLPALGDRAAGRELDRLRRANAVRRRRSAGHVAAARTRPGTGRTAARRRISCLTASSDPSYVAPSGSKVVRDEDHLGDPAALVGVEMDDARRACSGRSCRRPSELLVASQSGRRGSGRRGRPTRCRRASPGSRTPDASRTATARPGRRPGPAQHPPVCDLLGPGTIRRGLRGARRAPRRPRRRQSAAAARPLARPLADVRGDGPVPGRPVEPAGLPAGRVLVFVADPGQPVGDRALGRCRRRPARRRGCPRAPRRPAGPRCW